MELNLFFHDGIAVSLKLNSFGLNLYFFFPTLTFNSLCTETFGCHSSVSFLTTQPQFSETDFRSGRTTNCAQMHRSPIRVCKKFYYGLWIRHGMVFIGTSSGLREGPQMFCVKALRVRKMSLTSGDRHQVKWPQKNNNTDLRKGEFAAFFLLHSEMLRWYVNPP